MGTDLVIMVSDLTLHFQIMQLEYYILYGNANNGVDIPIFLNNIANPDLRWETTEQVNLGLDFAFLRVGLQEQLMYIIS